MPCVYLVLASLVVETSSKLMKSKKFEKKFIKSFTDQTGFAISREKLCESHEKIPYLGYLQFPTPGSHGYVPIGCQFNIHSEAKSVLFGTGNIYFPCLFPSF